MNSISIDTSNKTLRLVFSALMIAIGTVLSLFKFSGIWALGGGVTFCAMLPLVMISFIYGTKWGLFSAFIFSLLQMVLGMDNVMYGTSVGMVIAIALLDYIIAYTVIGLAAVFKTKLNNIYVEIVLGIILAMGLRLLCHFITGWMIWDALWPNDIGMVSPVYSIAYNGSYMIPEMAITSVVAVALEKALHFSKWSEKTTPHKS